MAKRRFTKKQVTYTIIGTIAVFTVAIWLFAFLVRHRKHPPQLQKMTRQINSQAKTHLLLAM